MAVSPDTIKDFLVGLGFKVDQNGLKTFMGTLEGVTKAAMAVGVGVTAAAVATVHAVATVSEQFEDLYYASKRIRDSVSNIKGYDFAIGQLGGTVEGSLGALEAIADFLRSNPGGERFIQSVGVATRDAQGNLRKTTDMMEELGKRFKAMPFYRAKVYANLLGIDDKTLMAMMKDTDKFKKQNAEIWKNAGIDPDKFSRDSVIFMNALRELMEELQAFGVLLATRLAPAALLFIEALRLLIHAIEWLDRNTGGISTDLIELAAGMGIASKAAKFLGLDLIALIGKAFIPLIQRIAFLVVDAFPALAEGFMLVADAIAAGGVIAFGVIGLIIAAIAGLIYAGYELWKHWDSVTKFLKDAWGSVGRFFSDVWAGLERTFKAGWEKIRPYVEAMAKLVKRDWAGALGAVAGGVIGLVVGGPAGAVAGAVAGGALGERLGSQGGRKAMGDAAKAAMDFFKQAGWTAAQAAGLVANIHRESGFNAGARGDSGTAFGLGQWHSDRQRAFAAWAGHDIQHSSFQEQLAFMNYELTKGSEKMAGNILRATKDAFSAGAVVSSQYERPADRAGEASRRGTMAEGYFSSANLAPGGGKKITVNQHNKTDITVHGTSTPGETAKAISGAQDRVHGDAVRNLKGALS